MQRCRRAYIDQHVADDPARAAAEYWRSFGADLEGYIQREVVQACVGDYHEILPTREHHLSGASSTPLPGRDG